MELIQKQAGDTDDNMVFTIMQIVHDLQCPIGQKDEITRVVIRGDDGPVQECSG